VRAVLLDFYGTLAHAVSWGPPYRDVLASHGYELHDDVRAAYGDNSVDGTEHVEHSQSRDHYEAWRLSRLESMLRDCGVGDDDVGRLAGELRVASRSFELASYPEVPAVLAELRSRGLTTVVCSNWDWDLDRAIEQTGLTDLLDVQVTSARAGARKPHPRIFEHTLEVVGLCPADALFVGDSWHADVEGPLAVGISAVHVQRDDDEREPPALLDGVRRVSDLTGLLELV